MAPIRPRVVRCAEHEFVQHDLFLINETEVKSRSAEETQKWLAEESEKALKYHLALNAYRNNLSPIHQLPNELLATVFALIAESCDQPAVGVHLSHVCRRWRSVALQLPVLWVTIDVDNLKRATAFLERSKNYPITIYWGPRPSPLNPLSDDLSKSKKCEAHEGLYDDLVRILPDHVKRIQKLCIKRQLAEDVTCFFQEIYGGPFTSLKEIIIDTKYPILLPSEEDHDPPMDAFRYEEAPKLTTVMLRGVHLTNWDENMFSGLRVLKLHDMDRGSLISFDTFMKGLKACPDLEELELHAAGLDPLSLVRDTGPAIALPKLRLLDLCLHVALTKHLLPRIIVPESAMVKVKCYTARQITTEYDIIPHGCYHLKPLRRVTKIRLQSEHFPTKLLIEGIADEAGAATEERVFSLDFSAPMNGPGIGLNVVLDLDTCFDFLPHIFLAESIRTISMAIHCESMQSLDFLEWFPNLEHLEYGSPEPREDNSDTVVEASEYQLRTIFHLPNLQTLSLHSLNLPEKGYDAIEELLQSREKRGLEKLKRLRVSKCEQNESDATHWKKLSTYVDKFVFEATDWWYLQNLQECFDSVIAQIDMWEAENEEE